MFGLTLPEQRHNMPLVTVFQTPDTDRKTAVYSSLPLVSIKPDRVALGGELCGHTVKERSDLDSGRMTSHQLLDPHAKGVVTCTIGPKGYLVAPRDAKDVVLVPLTGRHW